MITEYSRPKSEVLYSGEYPEMIEFQKPWECCVQVGQGRGGISTVDKPLISEGFGLCCALIMKNVQTLESALFHIDEINLSERQTPFVEQMIHNYIRSLSLSSEEQDKLLYLASGATRYWNPKSFTDKSYSGLERAMLRDRLTELGCGEMIKVCFVRGSESRNVENRVMKELLNHFGIINPTNILADTDNAHWGLLYKPKDSTMFVDARKHKKVLSFSF